MTTAKFKEFIKNSYPPRLLRLITILGIILLVLGIFMTVIDYRWGIPNYLDSFLVLLIFFINIALLPPAIRIGLWTLRLVFTTAKQMVLGFWRVPSEVKRMSSFQQYVLILLGLLIGAIFVAVIMK